MGALSPYQKKKFASIFTAQLVFFYLLPFYLPVLLGKQDFFGDTYAPLNKNAYVYVYKNKKNNDAGEQKKRVQTITNNRIKKKVRELNNKTRKKSPKKKG